uniref:L-gulonolactone oxidase 2-like C-terminal domain-containing protein n=1 Tax=Setaria viridis TaxID=4556 RepID=A0A4U6W6M3_SETVI|nr:hypothetical protein SEVIR_1G104000v2 [Setaria viridis]
MASSSAEKDRGRTRPHHQHQRPRPRRLRRRRQQGGHRREWRHAGQLIDAAAVAGLAVPYWLEHTVGGCSPRARTGAPSGGKGSAVHEYVGHARVRVLAAGADPELDAAKVSLGVLGVISQVTLALQPMFKRAQVRRHPLVPRPRGKAVYRVDDCVPVNTSGDSVYDFIGFRPTPTLAIKAGRLAEVGVGAMRNSGGRCATALTTRAILSAGYYGLMEHGLLPLLPCRGGRCLAGPDDALLTACPWDPRVSHGTFYFQSGISVQLSRAAAFIRDIDPGALCGVEVYYGILLRYARASSAHLSKAEDSVDFDLTYYRSRGDPAPAPRLHGTARGMPQWGKNPNAAMRYGAARVVAFVAVKRAFDPDGLFSSEWRDAVLGSTGGVSMVRDRGAMEGLCVCAQDSHCAPDNGYICRPGRVYKEARVCRHDDGDS